MSSVLFFCKFFNFIFRQFYSCKICFYEILSWCSFSPHLSLFVSICFFLSLSLCLSLSVSLSLCVCVCVCVPLSLSLTLSLFFTLTLSLCLFLTLITLILYFSFSGSAYALTGRFQDAINSFSNAIECDPTVAGAYFLQYTKYDKINVVDRFLQKIMHSTLGWDRFLS